MWLSMSLAGMLPHALRIHRRGLSAYGQRVRMEATDKSGQEAATVFFRAVQTLLSASYSLMPVYQIIQFHFDAASGSNPVH